ncbi:hypothetical protein CpipJ_CPIJ008395, partial [Culex quinquefasciatus]
ENDDDRHGGRSEPKCEDSGQTPEFHEQYLGA